MRYFLVATLAIIGFGSLSAADAVDYRRDVAPILQKYCAGCHTEGDDGGGLNMDTHAGLLQGGESGVAITAGQPASSRLILMVSGKLQPVMPPDDEPGPNEQELAILSAWIEQGAVGADGSIMRPVLRTPAIEPAANVERPITAISASPEGSRIAVARFGNVTIIDSDNQVLQTLDEQPGKVNSLQWSKDGSQVLLASGVTGAYGYAAVYDLETARQVTELVGHRDTLYAAIFSPSGERIATAGYDREIILWDAKTGEPIRQFHGHNGAIFDLAFSPDGTVLASACADETVKIWHVDSGQRLDTLSQPEGEVYAVDFTADGKFVVAGSSDNRLRIWRLVSKQDPRINPLIATRFVDESALVNFEFTPDGKAAVVLSEAGNVKVIRTSDWNQYATLEPLGEMASDLIIRGDSREATFSLMNGQLVKRSIPPPTEQTVAETARVRPVFLDLDQPQSVDEATLRKQQAPDPALAKLAGGLLGEGSLPLKIERGAEVLGSIAAEGEADLFLWQAGVGEVWAIDADVVDNGPLDPVLAVLEVTGQPVLRTRLQAVRDSYFTFRGKDSQQVGDFRLFNWQEMHLNDYLYAAGEVTRLWMHPRGPDSGFDVYPGEGTRWTYFSTTHTTHALGEPAYIVRPLAAGAPPLANGLPVFDVYYENDDDPMRRAGKNSRLLFTAPADGTYLIRVTDATGSGGQEYQYKLSLRAASPGFQANVQAANGTLRKGTGREFIVRVDRNDGFTGPVTFDFESLPAGLKSNAPVTIERGQRYAVGSIWADESTEPWEGKVEPELIATARIAGRHVERKVGKAGQFTLGERPSVIPSVQPIGLTTAENENWTLQVRRGETVAARVVIRRKEGFDAEVNFGKEDSGRNASHGVYVDNIGLNGLLVRANQTEREFFLTADPMATPGQRSFFLKANVDGGVTSHPITVEVLP